MDQERNIQEKYNEQILEHYRVFSLFTYPGCYREMLRGLPDNVRELGLLLRRQIVPCVVFAGGNAGYNEDLRYGNMKKVPWYRQSEDDYLVTVSGMVTELIRRDKRSITPERSEENRLILSCRYIAILTAAILKSKGIPVRARSGFAPYFRLNKGRSIDHWINQYWSTSEKRWITIDIDACIETLSFDPFDIPENTFDFAADSWLSVRRGLKDPNHFINTFGYTGLVAIVEGIFYDFHCLMNNEIIYKHFPRYAFGRFNQLDQAALCEIDSLARLLQDPDKNFQELLHLWKTERKFRILKGGQLL